MNGENYIIRNHIVCTRHYIIIIVIIIIIIIIITAVIANKSRIMNERDIRYT